MGHHEPALANGARRAERRAQRCHGVCLQRGSARKVEQARAAAQGVGRHSLRERRARGEGDPSPCRRPAFCARPLSQPHQRAARQAALLADLRGGGGGRPSCRRARLRLERPAHEQYRLALVLHRGDHRAFRFVAGLGGEPDRGGRVRALPRAQDRAHRGGFAWIPPLAWRLDQNWKRMKDEVPHLRKAPSEYLREHFWVSTQPMEESEEPDHVLDVMEWIGWDKILFASDYPHWDFDDPFLALPPSLSEERRNKIYCGNAKALYRLD